MFLREQSICGMLQEDDLPLRSFRRHDGGINFLQAIRHEEAQKDEDYLRMKHPDLFSAKFHRNFRRHFYCF